MLQERKTQKDDFRECKCSLELLKKVLGKDEEMLEWSAAANIDPEDVESSSPIDESKASFGRACFCCIRSTEIRNEIVPKFALVPLLLTWDSDQVNIDLKLNFMHS
ncbi:hypothetical protein Ciccas_000039 [Cichlidogyrus casuarinus]|uniref:Uncharacterized protein n=1 Tax=Cichlidogyrus casuarinus TaxID=1844966 RepID=A0ABD2QPC8_9PLAT